MNKLTFTLISAVLTLTFSQVASAAATSLADYTAGRNNATEKYKVEKKECKALAGNAKDICIEEAKGRESIAKAELEESYTPSEKHRYNVKMAKADAAYNVAKEKCDDLNGNAKDVCRKEAKSAHISAKADAKVTEKSNEATAVAREKSDNVRKDATIDKNDAAYAVAKEKCDAFTNEAKAKCMKDAKTTFGKM